MVRFTVLASGSKGNATVVTGGRTRILVDCGLSCRELFRRMRLVGENPETLDAIIITHEHSDHVNGVAVTARKLGIPVYFTEGTHRSWTRWLSPRKQMTYAQWLAQIRKQAAERQAEVVADEGEPDENDLMEAAEASGEPDGRALGNPTLGAKTKTRQGWGTQSSLEGQAAAAEIQEADPLTSPSLRSGSAQDDNEDGVRGSEAVGGKNGPGAAKAKEPAWLPAVEYFKAGEPFEIGDISVSPFTIPHDAADPCGFVFRAEGVRLGFATDLGYIPPNVKAQLQGVDLLLLESNHDLEMLRDGPYPWAVKQRVLSRVGHLSNEAAASFLEDGYDGQAAYVILAHLSESNNLPDLARVTAERALVFRASLLANRLLLAEQHEPLSPIDF
ncbi:MAG: MBL fold metallo-hydrolase [Terracidiphilus sp.]